MSTKQFVKEQWDRVAGWTSVAVGLAALLLGWLGVSDTAYPAEQLPYILSGGVFGLFFLGLGAVLLLSADLRDEWRKLDSIEDALRRPVAVPTELPAPADPAVGASNGNGRVRPGRRPVEARPRSS